MYDNRKLVLDSTLNVVTEMPTIDANWAVLNYPSRFSVVTYLQSNVPAGQGVIQGGPAGTSALASSTPAFYSGAA